MASTSSTRSSRSSSPSSFERNSAVLLHVPSNLGYPVLAGLVFGESAGLPLPGETALLTAGGLAAGGHLALPAVIAVAAVAAICGDTLGFWLGRRKGRDLLLRGGFLAAHRRHAVARADRFFARYGAATVFFGRWVPGVRVVAAVMAGATRMRWRKFAVANALGAFAWATTVATTAAIAGPTGAFALAAGGLALGAVGVAITTLRARRGRSFSGHPPDLGSTASPKLTQKER